MSKINNKQITGQLIKNARHKKRLTQSQVALSIGISRNYISDLETGRYIPSLKTLVILAKFLEIDLNSILKMS